MHLQLKKKALISPHPSTNFELKEYFENEPRFYGVYFRDNLSKTIKNGTYVINLDEHADVSTYWIALNVKINEVIYFLEEIKRFIGHKNTKTDIFGIQADNSIMCGYFCTGFINFIFAERSLIDFTSLFLLMISRKMMI